MAAAHAVKTASKEEVVPLASPRLNSSWTRYDV